jgi:hypothetical protein
MTFDLRADDEMTVSLHEPVLVKPDQPDGEGEPSSLLRAIATLTEYIAPSARLCA